MYNHVNLRKLKVQKHLSFLLFPVLLATGSAKAELVSAVDLNLGVTSFTLKSANSSRTISDMSSLEINYLLKHTGTSVAYLLSFGELFRSEDVSLPYTRLGFGLRYYPLGFNGSKVIMDSDVSAQVWKATPFVGLTMGIANVTVKDYNASLIEMAPRFGVELPLNSKMLFQFQMALLTGSSTGSLAREVSYQGVTGLVGLILTGL